MKNPFLVFFVILSSILGPPWRNFAQEEKKTYTLFLSVNDARLIAINNNLDIKLAKLDAKIKGTDLSYKEAIFDTILSGEITYTDDQRKQSSSLSGSKSLTNNYNIGIDKKLKSGTDVDIDWTNKRAWSDSTYVSTNPYHDSQIQINLTQPIGKNFFGMIDRGNIEIARQEIKNADVDSYTKIEEAIISAEKAYWRLAFLQEEFKIEKAMLKKAIRLFNQHRRKLKIGLVETGDVLASEANMHIRKSSILISYNKVKTACELLNVLLNLKNDVTLFAADSLTMETFDTTLAESLQNAFKHRRDYITGKNDIEAKNIRLALKSNSRFPEIDLKATFATNGISSKYYRATEDIFEDSNPEYYAGIEFKYPLENNEAKSEYEKAVLEKTRSIIKLQKIERQIISNIDETFRNLCLNKANISYMTRIENLQNGKLLQEEKRFNYGRSDSDTLIRYQEDLLNASIMVQKAYYDYNISILELMDAEDSFLGYIGME